MFNFVGYSANIKTYIEAVMKKYSEFDASQWEEVFESKKAKWKKDKENFFMAPPINQAYNWGLTALTERSDPAKLVEAADALTFDRF